MSRYEFIEKEKNNHSIERLCRAMRVSEAAYYAWRGRKSYQLSRRRSEQAAAVKETFYLHRRGYGARRISAELKASGLAVGRRLAGLTRDISG